VGCGVGVGSVGGRRAWILRVRGPWRRLLCRRLGLGGGGCGRSRRVDSGGEAGRIGGGIGGRGCSRNLIVVNWFVEAE